MRNILFFLMLLIGPSCMASRVDTIAIQSKALNNITKCVVIVPDSYERYKDSVFPVVFVLHGYTGDYSNWVKKVSDFKDYADQFQMILVCPDGKNSWYFDSKADAGGNYETYISGELPAYIDNHFRTKPGKDFRSICGLSMGGHGALYLAFRHQDVFGAAGSMSGVLDLMPFKNKYNIESIIGDTSVAAMEQHSDLQIAANNRISIPVIIDCGINDPFIGVNRAMHAKLIELKIPHDYIERFGGHTWKYWGNAIGYQLMFFRKRFDVMGGGIK